jgi:cobalt-zinc-cadmium efflux system outer membrane protein
MKTNRRNGLVLMILLMLSVLIVNAQDPLDTYLMEAANNNPGLKSRFSAYLAALEKVPQVGGLPDPQVSFGYFIQPVETRVGPMRAKFSATQMFPWFGTLGAKRDATTEMAKVKYEEFREARSRLFFDVKSTYYNLYFIQKAIGISIRNISLLGMLRKVALVKVESGMASSVDVLRVEMEIADLRNQLALLKDKYRSQVAGFNNLLNVDSQRIVSIPDSLPNVPLAMTREAVLDSIRMGNHQVLQMEFAEASYEKQEVAARRTGLPNFMIGMDYTIVGKSPNPSLSSSESGKDAIVFPMVGITIPIYRNKYESMAKEAILLQQSAESGKIDRINILETTFEKAYAEYLDADRRIPLFGEQSVRAEKTLGILRTGYETSGKNFEEVVRMERRFLQYQLELEKARADKKAAIAFIDYLAGQ